MSEKRLPTPAQRRLVNIGIVLQFHCAAIGHLVVSLWMFYELMKGPPEGWSYEDWSREGGLIAEAFLYMGIPISFGILVAVYIIFRLLLAYFDFGTALVFMIVIDVLHALGMGIMGIMGAVFFCIVPLRLVIPIVLYLFAYYFYVNMPQKAESPDVS